jgi:peptidoglycan/xylan/chitin deacetylase (PgdA/CDA1 family)
VLIYHDVPESLDKTFKHQLQHLAKEWTFIGPSDFSELLNSENPTAGKYLLLSFDDGFLSNYRVAKNILNPLGIKALFFVIEAFASVRKDERTAFIKNNIYSGQEGFEVNQQSNMTLSMIKELAEDGHGIGAHTRTHAYLSKISDGEELHREIIKSAEALEQSLGIEIEHFAFPFGTLESIGPRALNIAKKKFKFLHTGLRGNNFVYRNPYGVCREAVSLQDDHKTLDALVNGGADWHYQKKLDCYKSWQEPTSC